jgi:hypothetical protein
MDEPTPKPVLPLEMVIDPDMDDDTFIDMVKQLLEALRVNFHLSDKADVWRRVILPSAGDPGVYAMLKRIQRMGLLDD